MKKQGTDITMTQSEYDKLVKNLNWLIDIVANGHDNSNGEADFAGDAEKAKNIKKTLKIEEDTSALMESVG